MTARYGPRMKKETVVNQKGGVGKTTNTWNIGGACAEAGLRTLMVDLDPQGNLTKAARKSRAKAPATLSAAMLGRFDGPVRDLIVPVADHLDLVPSGLDMFTLGRELHAARAAHDRLGRVLEQVEGDYDICFVDCPPSLDITTDNALLWADGVVIPVDVDEFSLDALRLLLVQVRTLMEEMRRPAPVYRGLVINRLPLPLSAINRATYDAFHALRAIDVIAEIPVRSALAEARKSGQTITQYQPRSDVAQMYRDLAKTAGYLP